MRESVRGTVREEPRLRILLIAYEFPPGPSPQSLRWARLTRELVNRGVQVRVLSVQRNGEPVRLPVPTGLVVDRTPPGAASGLLAHIRSAHATERTGESPGMAGSRAGGEPPPVAPGGTPPLNWKGRLVERMNRIAGLFTFPDHFGQWELATRLRLRQLLDDFQPDVVISSHEPATTLMLGRLARERGFAWIADLGDPVESGYTPARWRRRARSLEAWTCVHASHVTVTTEATKQLLVTRHGADPRRFSVLPQGYDPRAPDSPVRAPPADFSPALLELVYTGSFYAFRRPASLVNAVLQRKDVRLTVACRTPPEWLREIADSHPGQVRLLGFLGHAESVSLQQASDVLVNIANDDPVQVPGKVFEYLGASRPILHIGACGAVGGLLRDRGRGMSVADSAEAVGAAIEEFWRIKATDAWHRSFDLDNDLFPEYRWSSIGGRLFELVASIAAGVSSRRT